jgi:hypothetical protein
MSHPAIDIANGVTAELNAATFSQSFTATRKLVPFYPEEELTALKVTVVPKTYEETVETRQSSMLTIVIDVAVQKKLSDIETDAPAMLQLVDEMMVFFKGRSLTTYPNVRWMATQNEPIYSQEHLGQYKVFTSVFSLTYRVRRHDG